MTTTCTALDRWLDDGGDPDALPAPLAGHAAGCVRCGRALAAERALLEALAAPLPARAPAGLVDAALARALAAPPAARGRPVVLWLLLAGCVAGAVGSAALFASGLAASEGASVEAPDLRPGALVAEGAVRGAALAAEAGDAWLRAYEAAPPVLQVLLALALAGTLTVFARWLARQAAGRGAGRLLVRGRV